MSEAKSNSEPSMEEILASIRRIIAEDGEAPAEGAAVAPEGEPMAAVMAPTAPPADDVLDLTEIVGEAPPPPPAPEPVSTASMLRQPEPEPAPEPKPAPAPVVASPPMEGEGLVSTAAASSSAAAFASIVNRPRRQSTGDIPMGNAVATLEELVKELVTPMLKQWLDSNLPTLVERLVQEEIQRLARHGL